MLNKIKTRLSSLPLPGNLAKKPLLISAGAVLLAGSIVISLWHSNQGYVALYGSQENIPVAQVVEVLGAEAIPYRINPENGQLLVTEKKLPLARMALAGKGISARLPDGYDLMDKEELLGSSQFIQNVRYKRSLEGELARSIMALDAVENARVHLGLNEASSFVMSNMPESSASVMVKLRYGKQLDVPQVAAIVQLVSGSIPGMKANNVQVIDQAGNLLSESLLNGGDRLASLRQDSDIVRRIQEATRKNIADLLVSLVGAGNYRISVAPEIDMSAIEETQESLGNEPRVSDETISKESTTNELAIGIPGSLSNRPPAPKPVGGNATSADQQAAGNSNPQSLSNSSQEQRKYQFDRNIRHIRHPGFRLEKLRVAVALNKSAPALAHIPPEQLESLTRLVSDAAGIEKTRGDSLTLDLLAFTDPVDTSLPDLKWWQDPDIQYWGEYAGIGLLALLTLLLGVLPLVKRVSRRVDAKAAPAQPETIMALPVEADDEAISSLSRSAFQQEENLPPQSSGLETKIEYLQTLAQNETERVAEVLKQWISNNERSNSKPDQ